MKKQPVPKEDLARLNYTGPKWTKPSQARHTGSWKGRHDHGSSRRGRKTKTSKIQSDSESYESESRKSSVSSDESDKKPKAKKSSRKRKHKGRVSRRTKFCLPSPPSVEASSSDDEVEQAAAVTATQTYARDPALAFLTQPTHDMDEDEPTPAAGCQG